MLKQLQGRGLRSGLQVARFLRSNDKDQGGVKVSEDPFIVELRDINYRIQQLILKKQQYNSSHVKSDGITERQISLVNSICDRTGLDRFKDLDQWTKKNASAWIDNQLNK